MARSELSPRQELFAVEFALTGDKAAAYRKAGGKGKIGGVAYYATLKRWLSAPGVADRIKEVQAKREERAVAASVINRNWVENNLVEVVTRAMQKEAVFDHDGVPIGVWKFDSAAAIRGLELCGKTLAMFTDKQITEDIDKSLAGKTDEEVQDVLKSLLHSMGPAHLKRVLAEMEAHGPSGSSENPDGGEAAEARELQALPETGGVPPGRLN